MKILIAGNGKVADTLTRQLSGEGYELTLIDSDRSVLESAMERYDVMTVEGNCASMAVLERAGVKSADLLIALTGTDEVNLLCCITARGLNPELHTVARIRDPEYIEQAYSMRGAFSLSLVVNPERQAAAEIERLLKYPGFLKRDTFAKGRIEIVELRVEQGGKLSDVPLSGLGQIVGCRVLVCAVLRNGTAVAPDGHFVLRAGDRLFVTATSDNLATLLKNLGMLTHKVRHILLAGGNRVAYYLAESLGKSGMTVRLIEEDPARCLRLASLLPSIDVVEGDPSDPAILESEGLSRNDALVTVTDQDEENIVISLYGNSAGVKQIITNLNRIDDSRMLSDLPVGSCISPSKLCCNSIIRYVRALRTGSGAAVAVHSIADGQAEAIEFPVDETTLWSGTPLRRLKLRRNTLIVGINRGLKTEIPNGDSTFRVGDSVVIVTGSDHVITRLNDIFEP